MEPTNCWVGGHLKNWFKLVLSWLQIVCVRSEKHVFRRNRIFITEAQLLVFLFLFFIEKNNSSIHMTPLFFFDRDLLLLFSPWFSDD